MRTHASREHCVPLMERLLPERHERERASFDKIRVQPKIPEEAGRAVHNSGEGEGEWLMALFRALGSRVK